MPRERRGMRKRGELARARKAIDKTLTKGMANTLRNQILALLNERPESATGIAKELGIDFKQVNYEMEQLRKLGLIERVGEEKRGGAKAVYYVATARAYICPEDWQYVADPIKAGLRAGAFQNLAVDAATAINEETYDALPDAHMSWTPLLLDELGFKELTDLAFLALKKAEVIQVTSAERLLENDEEGIPCTATIMAYTGASPKRKIGLPPNVEELADFGRWIRERREKAIEAMLKQEEEGSQDLADEEPKDKGGQM